jgi:hypothetical protein
MRKPVISSEISPKFDGFKTCDFLPKPQVQASQFQVHISYFLQKCKKGKPSKTDLPFLKNDITTF